MLSELTRDNLADYTSDGAAGQLAHLRNDRRHPTLMLKDCQSGVKNNILPPRFQHSIEVGHLHLCHLLLSMFDHEWLILEKLARSNGIHNVSDRLYPPRFANDDVHLDLLHQYYQFRSRRGHRNV